MIELKFQVSSDIFKSLLIRMYLSMSSLDTILIFKYMFKNFFSEPNVKNTLK